MMLLALTLLSCDVRPNDPPRFQSFNGQDIRYILGFATFRDLELVLQTKVGASVDMEVEIRDPNGDELQMLFPLAPPGMDWEADSLSGTWNVPEDYWQPFTQIQVLAVDDRGAADVLFVPFAVEGALVDSGDFSFDGGAWFGEGGDHRRHLHRPVGLGQRLERMCLGLAPGRQHARRGMPSL